MALTNVWLIQDYSSKDFSIKNDDIVIDVGAHIGLFALFASQYCKSGKIYCFEPVKENYDLLLETLISPDQVVQSPEGEHYALRNYSSTSLGPKTCVVIYRDDDNGFVITSLLTSKPQQFVKRGVTVWKQ